MAVCPFSAIVCSHSAKQIYCKDESVCNSHSKPVLWHLRRSGSIRRHDDVFFDISVLLLIWACTWWLLISIWLLLKCVVIEILTHQTSWKVTKWGHNDIVAFSKLDTLDTTDSHTHRREPVFGGIVHWSLGLEGWLSQWLFSTQTLKVFYCKFMGN